MKDISLLKIGRHFRLTNGDKVVVGHDEFECERLSRLCHEEDHLLVPINFSGPTVILQGSSFETAVDKMLEYTNRSLPKTPNIAHLHGKNRRIFSLSGISARSHAEINSHYDQSL